MDTRFFMPPDSSAGLARSVPARPTSANFSATIARSRPPAHPVLLQPEADVLSHRQRVEEGAD